MLVDIKIEISSILHVNNNLVKVAELRKDITAHKSEIDKLKTSLDATKKRNKTLENDITAARKTVDEQDEEIAELYDLQDKLEQYTRKQLLEIHRVPEVLYSTTEEAVLKIAEKLDVPIEPEDINISDTIKGKGIEPILVKFHSHKTKTRLYRARTKLKNIKVSKVASAATRVVAEKIFIHENLMSFIRSLTNKVNQKRRDGLLYSAWTIDGKIFVKNLARRKSCPHLRRR